MGPVGSSFQHPWYVADRQCNVMRQSQQQGCSAMGRGLHTSSHSFVYYWYLVQHDFGCGVSILGIQNQDEFCLKVTWLKYFEIEADAEAPKMVKFRFIPKKFKISFKPGHFQVKIYLILQYIYPILNIHNRSHARYLHMIFSGTELLSPAPSEFTARQV